MCASHSASAVVGNISMVHISDCSINGIRICEYFNNQAPFLSPRRGKSSESDIFEKKFLVIITNIREASGKMTMSRLKFLFSTKIRTFASG